jgi:hypothetical protein
MSRFVLGSSGSLGLTPEEEAWYGGEGVTPEIVAAFATKPVAPATPPTSPTSGGSIFGGLFSALTSPATVTATLNKYVFGSTAPIPTATNRVMVPSSPSIIAGIPNSYLMIGGAAILFLVMSKGRR